MSAGLKEVPCCDYRIYERVRYQLLAATGGQVVDYAYVFCCCFAVFSGEQISLDQTEIAPAG